MSRRTQHHKRALTTSLLTLAVGAGLAVVPASSAQAEPTQTTRLTMSLSRSWGVFYDGVGPALPEDTFTVRGRLTSDGENVGGRTIQLFRQMISEPDNSPLTMVEGATATTKPDGTYAITGQRVVGGAFYGVEFAGDDADDDVLTDTYLMDRSPLKLQTAARDFNARAPKIDGKLFFRGNINPGWNGRKVYLQKKACGTCGWRTVSSMTAGSTGGWNFRVYYPKNVGPVWRWQAVISGAGDFEKSFSAMLTTNRVYNRGGDGQVASLR